MCPLKAESDPKTAVSPARIQLVRNTEEKYRQSTNLSVMKFIRMRKVFSTDPLHSEKLKGTLLQVASKKNFNMSVLNKVCLQW